MADLRTLPILAALTVLTCASAAHASAPAGVWALVDQVTLLPDANKPSVVRIDGTFIVANQLPDFPQYPGYSEPQSGYMYYSCSEKLLATCVMEWKELLAVVGTADTCRGWGSNALPNNGSVRPAQDALQSPDLYPIAMGVVQGFSPCEALKAWKLENPDTTGGGEGSTGGGEGGTGGGDTNTTTTTGESGTTVATGDATGGGATGDVTGAGSGDVTGGATGDVTGGGATGDVTGDATVGDATGKDVTGDVATEGNGSVGETGKGSGESGGSDSESGNAEPDDKGCGCDSAGDPLRGAPATRLALLGLGLLRRRKA